MQWLGAHPSPTNHLHILSANSLANHTCSVDVKLKVEAATTLRDSLDHYTSGPIYTPFLKKLVPIFINILRGQCIFQSNSLEQVRIPHC